jgi:ABC-2 type transport system ATP-binding protein
MGEKYRGKLGYLPQDFGYYPDLTVYDYLMYIASIKGLRPIAAKSRGSELLEQVGLKKYKKRKMKTLSGGMLRRVGIAQAMLNDPQILVLDVK